MSVKKLSGLGEFGWLKRLLPSLYWPPSLRSHLGIGPGDDAGVLKLTPGKRLVASTDAMVEGIHFDRHWFSWEDLGYKVLAVNLSDLAAMGNVKPLAALVTAAFPGDTSVDAVDKFYKGLENCAKRWKTGLLGGDTVGSTGGSYVNVTILGEADAKNLLIRSSARPGEWLATTGPLGLASAGLNLLMKGGVANPSHRLLLQAFRRPTPRFDEAKFLATSKLATSLMDCSDGLEASARILSDASRIGVEIWMDKLPITPAFASWAKQAKKDPRDVALTGGEDYELIFTVRPNEWSRVQRRLPLARIIGRTLAASAGVCALRDGQTIALQRYGFSHFAKP